MQVLSELREKWDEAAIKAILNGEESIKSTGPMTDNEIRMAFYTGDLYISPFNPECLTPIGYNLQPSDIIISTKTGLPLKILEKGNKRFVQIAPHDTVLVVTNESLYVGSKIMGTFHSRVRTVSQGFGHISTTLDPNWKGPLLIAINNPTGQKKKFILETNGKLTSFATIVFYRLNKAPKKVHDNPPIRTDVLKEYQKSPNSFKKFLLGNAYKKYDEMVTKLTEVFNFNVDNLPDVNNEIKNVEQLIEKIKAQYTEFGYLNEVKLFSDLEAAMVKQNAVSDIGMVCRELIEITISAILYFDKQFNNTANAAANDKYTFTLDFLNFLNAVLIQLRYEQQTLFWMNKYRECSKIAQSDSISARWTRIILSPTMGAKLFKLLVLVFLIGVLYFIISSVFANATLVNDASIYTALIALVTPLLVLVAESLLFNKTK